MGMNVKETYMADVTWWQIFKKRIALERGMNWTFPIPTIKLMTMIY